MNQDSHGNIRTKERESFGYLFIPEKELQPMETGNNSNYCQKRERKRQREKQLSIFNEWRNVEYNKKRMSG